MDVHHGSARPVAGGAAEVEYRGAQIEGERVGLIGGGLPLGPAVVRERLAAASLASVRIQRRSVPWRFDSPQAMTEFLLAHSPGHQASVRQLAADQAAEMLEAVERLAGPHGAPIHIDAEYLLFLART